MKQNRLSHIRWKASEKTSANPQPKNGVSVSVGEILPTLSHAFQNGFQWVHDFSDDQIQIPRDLLDLIQLAKQGEG